MDAPELLTTISVVRRDVALRRHQELQPYLQGETTLKDLAHTLKVSPRTLSRRVAAYKDVGVTGLTRHLRSDKGLRQFPLELLLLAEGLAVQKPIRPITTIHHIIERVAVQQEWPVPGYHTVQKLIKAMDKGMVMLALKGSKAYREAFDLLYRFTAHAPNEIWQADHSPLPICVRDPKGRSLVPWLTVILDDFSRAVPGYALNLNAPNSLQTALALRQGIWRKDDPRWRVCGIPALFYSDHGSDFTSKHMETVAADLHMPLAFSEIGFPRGRGKIERFFRTINEECLSKLPGYAPKGEPRVAGVLTVSELNAHIRAFLLDTYHQRKHSETEEPPQARWEAGGFLPNMPQSLDHLDLLLLTMRDTRKVMGDGIHAFGNHYLHVNLAAYVGEEVVIRYDPSDIAEVRVFHRDEFLGRAIDQELAGQRISLKDITHARSERRQELKSGLKTRAQLVAKYLAVHQPTPSPLPSPSIEEAPRPRLKRYENE